MPRVVVKPVLRKKSPWGASIFAQQASKMLGGPAARALLGRTAASKDHQFAKTQRKAPNSQHNAHGRIKPGTEAHLKHLPKWSPRSPDK